MPLWRQISSRIPEGTNVADQTVLVTGANVGLGYECARQFLLLGASTLIVTTRSDAKGEQTVGRLRKDPEVAALDPAPNIFSVALSLDDYDSVHTAVESIEKLTGRLNVVVHNAGVVVTNWSTTKQNHEMGLQVNYLAPAYFALALLPLLQRTSNLTGVPSRFTWISSEMQFRHTYAKFDLDAPSSVLGHLDDREKFAWLTRYQDTKALASWFIADLATHVDPHQVIINSMCPGPVSGTELNRSVPTAIGILGALYKRIRGHGLDEGVQRYIHAAIVVGQETHGKFIRRYEAVLPASLPFPEASSKIRQKVWDETIAEIRNTDPSATEGL